MKVAPHVYAARKSTEIYICWLELCLGAVLLSSCAPALIFDMQSQQAQLIVLGYRARYNASSKAEPHPNGTGPAGKVYAESEAYMEKISSRPVTSNLSALCHL